MTIHLSIFSTLYKYLFNLLFLLHLWIQRAFPSAKPIFMCLNFLCDPAWGLRFPQTVFCVSLFYATTVSAFSYPQSLFSVSQFFMRQRPPLFLIRKAHFLCFSVFFLITASPFPYQAKPVFCFLVF